MNIINSLDINDFGEMEGKIYCKPLAKELFIEFPQEVEIEYVERMIKYLNELDNNVINKLCEYSIKYCKDIMYEYPYINYSFTLKDIKKVTDILDYISIERLRIDKCEENNENILALNLSGSCEWSEEGGIEWLIKDNIVTYVGRWDDLNIWHSPVEDEYGNYVTN